MKSKFDFSTLLPERDTFTDLDDQDYEFKSRVEFGAVDLARIRSLQSQIDSMMKTLTEHPDNEEAAQNLEALASKFVKFILPALPETRIDTMTLVQKTKIVEWWTEHQKDDDPVGEVAANQPKN